MFDAIKHSERHPGRDRSLEDKVFDIVDVCVEIATNFKMAGPLDRMIVRNKQTNE